MKFLSHMIVVSLFVLPVSIGNAQGTNERIRVYEASYGSNHGVRTGNVTHYVEVECNGKRACRFDIDHRKIGDPARGKRKDFIVSWWCGAKQARKRVDEEASGKSVELECPSVTTQRIKVISATYGAVCGVRQGTHTSVVSNACDGRESCSYRIDHRQIGDPARGCQKDFIVEYECGGFPLLSTVSKEASGKTIDLKCAASISVVEASYGKNCGTAVGTFTRDIRAKCANKAICDVKIDQQELKLGDPAPDCTKDFVVRYFCGGDYRVAIAPPEALGEDLRIACN